VVEVSTGYDTASLDNQFPTFSLKYQELIMQWCSIIFKENRILKLGMHHHKSLKHENANMYIIILFKVLEPTIYKNIFSD